MFPPTRAELQHYADLHLLLCSVSFAPQHTKCTHSSRFAPSFVVLAISRTRSLSLLLVLLGSALLSCLRVESVRDDYGTSPSIFRSVMMCDVFSLKAPYERTPFHSSIPDTCDGKGGVNFDDCVPLCTDASCVLLPVIQQTAGHQRSKTPLLFCSWPLSEKGGDAKTFAPTHVPYPILIFCFVSETLTFDLRLLSNPNKLGR